MQSSPALFLLVPLALSGCNKLLTKQAGAAPSAGPSIELFVPAKARHIGVAMPVQLSVAVPQAEAGSPGQAAPGRYAPSFRRPASVRRPLRQTPASEAAFRIRPGPASR